MIEHRRRKVKLQFRYGPKRQRSAAAGAYILCRCEPVAAYLAPGKNLRK